MQRAADHSCAYRSPAPLSYFAIVSVHLSTTKDAMDSSRSTPPGSPSHRSILISVAHQRLALLVPDRARMFPVSTARWGTGAAEGSQQTPLGAHRIRHKIGGGAAWGTIFKARRSTGAVWDGVAVDDDLILSRILWLEGLEDGVNRGAGIDSFDRYIYIHGTNHEQLIGTPASHGCVRMRNDDIIELFDCVEEGDRVIIS